MTPTHRSERDQVFIIGIIIALIALFALVIYGAAAVAVIGGFIWAWINIILVGTNEFNVSVLVITGLIGVLVTWLVVKAK